MKRVLIVLMMCLISIMGFGQNTLTVHDGTATNSYVPVYGLWVDDYTRTEIIYPADELSTMTGGTINSITFYKNSTNTNSWGAASFQIHLKEVTETSLSNYITIDDATLVYSGTIDVSGGERTVTITFNTPYQYNGGNLLFSVYQTAEGSYSSAYWYGENVTGMSASGYNGSNAVNATFNQRNFIPKTTFEYTLDPSVCQKPNNLLVSNITSNSATISWSGNATSYNIRTNCKRYNFDTGFQGWTTIDADGDGYDWIRSSILMAGYLIPSHQGIDMLSSQSYDGIDGALNPDNYLVSPLMQFGEGAKITFWVAAQDEDYAEEHFGVAISTNGNINPNDFTTIAEWTNPQNMSDYLEYTVDLSSYSGQGYVAIRHFDCTDMFYLNIDDITICEKGSILIENVSSPYIFTNLQTDTEYTYLIESDCGNGNLSTLTSINFTTNYIPLQFLDIVEEPVCWDFEAVELLTMPNKWTNEGDRDWTVGIGDYSGSTTGAHSGSRNLLITHNSTGDITYLCLPLMNLSNIESGKIIFWFINRKWVNDIDELDVCYRINNGNWISLFHTVDAHSGWTEQNVNLPSEMFTNNVQIAFKYTDNYGYGVGLDDICLELYDAQGNMLPINLLEFSVEPRYDHQTGVHVLNLLTIRTGYEYNNCEFIVYRSEDAINWDYDIPVCDWDFGKDSAIYNEALDTILNYFTIEHPNGQTYYPVDTIPYPVTYYKLIQRDCDNTSTEYTSEIIVCIANQQKNLIEPYVICDNGPQIVGGSEVCEVFVQNVLGQVVEEFQLQPYQQREVLAEIQGMYLITFVYKYNGEARKKTEKIVCM